MKLSPVVPFEPIRTEKIPIGEHWISQVKWDGVRMLLYYDGDRVKLVNRKLHDRTMQYPELTNVGGYCLANSIILDGEVIAFEQEKPSFHQVMKRDALRRQNRIDVVKHQIPIAYMIFDILYFNGDWVTGLPLLERQQILEKIIRKNDVIQRVSNHRDAEALFQAVADHGLEGIVLKDLNSSYAINGKDKRWQKKKIRKDLFAVVGGVTFRTGTVNALLLGLYDELGQLWYIGHAGTGKLTKQDWKNLTAVVRNLRITERPFVNTPDRLKNTTWIKPEITVKINFLEWTSNKTLRQPSVQAIVKGAGKQCTFAQT